MSFLNTANEGTETNRPRSKLSVAVVKGWWMAWVFMAGFAVKADTLRPVQLRTEWLPNPLGIESTAPRFSWRLESKERGARQTAYEIRVAPNRKALRVRGQSTLWDSGHVESDESLNIVYKGMPLSSGQLVYWSVRTWDQKGNPSKWSEPAFFSVGLLHPEDWKAQWISFHDNTPLHNNPKTLYLPSARYYRKEFDTSQGIARATLYFSCLGLAEMHLNGERVGDAYFESGWADYHQRAYYRTADVTKLVKHGANCLGAIVADGWYAGYVGYGLLVGYGPNRTGRNIYGKTPAVLGQLEIEYQDGSRKIIGTDESWRVSGNGPIREADLIMGESYDARAEMPGWAEAGYPSNGWEPAVRAESNGNVKALFHEPDGAHERDFGFRPPQVLQSYPAPPIRVTQELKSQRLTEPKPGVFIFDLGQNFAGVIRLRLRAPAGTRLQLRYGEMLHKDGSLMTENLRKARATDFYVCRGDGEETWSPRFTYHGFQYVEVSGLPSRPSLELITGLVVQNDTPQAGEFDCSDPLMTRFAKNAQWTQRANFIEIPTDCPQRDERLGWMGDAQVYARTATYNADVAAFFTKWIEDVREAQRSFGAYPDYCPYPFAHGAPGATHGTAWTDAGVIVPYTMRQVYGDTRLVEKHWPSMVRFMEWRHQVDPELKGVGLGNTWGDWLNVNENTPIEYVDLCYHANSARLMADMATRASDKSLYAERYQALQRSWAQQFLKPEGILAVDTQTAYVLALAFGLAEEKVQPALVHRLAGKLATNGYHMATGFLGTKALLPVLTEHGQNDLAVRLFQSRQFPSWGYEVAQGATSVWERWDSYTREHGFNGSSGNQNASMNSFSHYSFGAVMEWAYRSLAGIETQDLGFKKILLRPNPPSPGSNPEQQPIAWVKSHYDSARGRIVSNWRRTSSGLEFEFLIPPNTTATINLPAQQLDSVRENGKTLKHARGIKVLGQLGDRVQLSVESGSYRFETHY